MRIEGAREFRISEGATRVHISVVLRLLTDIDGLEGNAEVVSAPPGKPEEFLEEIVGAIERYVAPALVGMPVRERGRAVQAVAMALKGRVWTKAAVTNALYDLHAKAIGVPIADLLGGQLLQRVPVIGPVVGIMSADAMATEAAAQSQAGFLAIKIKVGETVEADIDRVAAVRAAIGESAVATGRCERSLLTLPMRFASRVRLSAIGRNTSSNRWRATTYSGWPRYVATSAFQS